MSAMLGSGDPPVHTSGTKAGQMGQQLHVSGVFIVLLELALVVENLLPILVVLLWLPAQARGVGDRLVAAFSVTCILSALVPTPLGLASYFSGGWYGGAATCTTYQVTSIWCNLSSLALLTYMCVNCHFAVWHLRKRKPAAAQRQLCTRPPCTFPSPSLSSQSNSSCPSTTHPSASPKPSPCSTSQRESPSTDLQNDYDSSSPQYSISSKDNASAFSAVTQSGNPDVAKRHGSKRKHRDWLNQDPDTMIGVVRADSSTLQVVSGHDVQIRSLQTQENTAPEDDNVFGSENNFSNHNGSQTSTLLVSNGVNHASISHNTNVPYEQLDQRRSYSISSAQYNNTNKGVGAENGRNREHAKNRSNAGPNRSQDSEIRVVGDDYSHNKNSRTEMAGHSGGHKNCLCFPRCQSRDYVSLMLFFLYSCTLAISSLPVVGFGPQTVHSETSCRSWLVPIPAAKKERTFFVVFLSFVYLCLVTGCSSGISVCLQVSKRMKQERKRRSRLYHEEENVPDLAELSVLDDMKRQYSLTCIVMAGLLTWLPIVLMLTLQKSGVAVSEATLMYSNIATSLPGLLNPLLYSLALARYRTGYKTILEKCCCKRRKPTPHHLRDMTAQTEENDVHADTTLDTSAEGHTCLHGRTNPTFDGHLEVTIEEVEDDEDDEDCFPDDCELLEGERRMEQVPKLSEKTPLQAMAGSKPVTTALKTALTSRAKSPWQRRQEVLSPCEDKECLLVSRPVFPDEETGL